MTTLYRIPVQPYPLYTEQCELDGVTYSFRFRWSERASCWHMDLRTVDDVPIALSVRLVTGIPLLRRVVKNERPPGELLVLDLVGQDGECTTLEDFGSRFGLFYITLTEDES